MTAAACGGGGQSASPAHTVKKGADKTKHVVKEAVRKPVGTTKKVAKKTSGTAKKVAKKSTGTVKQATRKTVSTTKKAARNTKNAVRHTSKDTTNSMRKPSHTSSSSSSTSAMGNVTAGAKLYASTCESCHGKGGIGTASAPRLAAPSAVVSQFGTESSLEAFIAHNMPATNPGSLTATQAHNVAGYIWHLDVK